MSTALKAFVSIFSFVVTFFAVFLLFSLFAMPFGSLLDHTHHPALAVTVGFAPIIIALPAALQAARVAIRLETERQQRRAAKMQSQS